MKMFKSFGLAVALFIAMLALPSVAKSEYSLIVGAGGSWNQSQETHPADGNVLVAKSINNSGTFSFTMIDIMPVSLKPFKVAIAITPGVAQRVLTFNGVPVYGTVNIGPMVGGTENVGYSFSGGATAAVGLGRSIVFMPNFRVLKSSLLDKQYIFGAIFAWGSK